MCLNFRIKNASDPDPRTGDYQFGGTDSVVSKYAFNNLVCWFLAPIGLIDKSWQAPHRELSFGKCIGLVLFQIGFESRLYSVEWWQAAGNLKSLIIFRPLLWSLTRRGYYKSTTRREYHSSSAWQYRPWRFATGSTLQENLAGEKKVVSSCRLYQYFGLNNAL